MARNSDTETRIVYTLNDQDTPYLTKMNIAPNEITLGHFKRNLGITGEFKFFFKAHEEDVGIVREQITEDNAKLPLYKGRVVAWLVALDGTNLSDRSNSQSNGLRSSNSNLMGQASGGKYTNRNYRNLSCDTSDCETTETESVISQKRDRRFHSHHKAHFNHRCCNESVALTSDIDSTTFVDTDDESQYYCPNGDYDNDLDDCDNLSTTSEETSISKVAQNRLKKKNRLLQRAKMQARSSSVTSITDSNVSHDVITVCLNLTKGSFLGISIYGQCYSNGDNGIYVGSIMDGGVVQQDGRISVGDMILQVNDVNFENVSNDDAVRVLREAVSKLGPIKLLVAKYSWLRSLNAFGKQPAENASSEDTLNLRDQPVRPIDAMAWVEHTKQMNRSSKDTNSQEIDINNIQLTTKMEMLSIARAMSAPNSGLEIKDRTWLKITFPNAFLGSDMVDWLNKNVQGLGVYKDARKYAENMLKSGYIRHTLNKNSFSKQCYYTFSDMVVFIPSAENLSLDDGEPVDNYGLQAAENSQHNPSQFLPLAQNTVSYGVFEACASMQDNASHQASNFQSMASSCSDQLSQASGPIHISNFQQHMQAKGQQQQPPLFYSNQQQLAQQLLNHPPFVPQPSSSGQASNFFNQFEQANHHLRAASSNSSETQSSLNTISTRDTAIGVGSGGLMSKNNLSNNHLPNNQSNLSNMSKAMPSNQTTGFSNLLSSNGYTNGLASGNGLPASSGGLSNGASSSAFAGNGLPNVLSSSGLANNLSSNFNSLSAFTSAQQVSSQMNGSQMNGNQMNGNQMSGNQMNGMSNLAFNMSKMHLDHTHSSQTASEFNAHSNQILDDEEGQLIIAR